MNDDCIFCSIVAGTAPSRKLAETERAVAFLDIFPLTRGHALVIPKQHARDLFDVPADDLTAVALLAQQVGTSAMGELAAEGVNLLQANGAVAYQTVFHFHVHVLPRYRGDGFKVVLDRKPGDDADMDAVADGYRRGLGD